MSFPQNLTNSVLPSAMPTLTRSPLEIPSGSQNRSILFVDAGVEDISTLVQGTAVGTEVHLLRSGQDAVAQITQTLLGRSGIESLQIVSHGRSGGIQLGESWLDLQGLPGYVGQMKSWGAALSESADILLYGCNVAAGAVGRSFINLLAQATGADVAASDNLTGLGGDWSLEVRTGEVAMDLGLLVDRYRSTLDARQVKDIVQGLGESQPENLISFNGVVYFTASDNVSGFNRELWKSDGTVVGTKLVKDIKSGLGSSFVSGLTKSNNLLYFAADDGIHGRELWKTDGTEAGTVLVKDIIPGFSASNPSNFTDVNGTLFFTADDGFTGTELWKSDGTAAGTTLVKDIRSGSRNSNPTQLTNVNGTLFFSAYDDTNGEELWKSNGTAAGTVLVKNINGGSGNSSPSQLTAVNNTLYFTTVLGLGSNQELWKSDGTESGTVMVKDIIPGSTGSAPRSLTNVNGTLYFTASDFTHGRELWKSDGSASGTVLVKDIVSGSDDFWPGNLTNVNGTLYFSSSESVTGRELWKSDGTSAGTQRVAVVGRTGSFLSEFTNVNGALYFSADDGTNGRELWMSDGTAMGTRIIRDIYVGNNGFGANNSNPSNLTDVNGKLYFTADRLQNGRELWTIDTKPQLPQADLLLRNSTSGELRMWGLDQGQIGAETRPQLWSGDIISPGPEWKLISGKSDMGGDGNRDFVWFNTQTTETAVWFMKEGANGLTNVIFGTTMIYSLATKSPIQVGQDWQLVGVEDLMGDDRPEFLWENRVTGASAIWQLNLTFANELVINTDTSAFITSGGNVVQTGGAASGWKITGVGNFDGDTSTKDILWFNEKTAEMAVWQMNGTSIQGSGYVKNEGKVIKPVGWKPVAIGNIDGIGTDEIVWQNGTLVATWTFGNNFELTNKSAVLSQNLLSGEQIQGLADLNLDGTLDLVTRRKSGGPDTTQIYYLNAANFQLSTPTGSRFLTQPQTAVPYVTGDSGWDVVDAVDLGFK
jgi:ELWxxDGT repeat protein